eukprot:TRINITY_DN3263_c3_g3_i1.p1 TRINITY_DN3263_c3_g3~~TRINITY_DN3263_c3_g3_i1.p1  ORF type:complete len:392 (+),score=90.56 TRINITY_DN3263_c3_g3_i1:113-1177(+)
MQNGVRFLRRINVFYDPRCSRWHVGAGGCKVWVDEWLPKWRERNPDVEVNLVGLTDPRMLHGDFRYPKIEGEYLSGAVTTWQLDGQSAEACEQAANDMRNTCNDSEPRPHDHAVIETQQPSVQGIWTPYLWMKDAPAPAVIDWEQRWRDELRDIAKYVRSKKEHREREFKRKNWVGVGVRERMQKRWKEEVFPYTIGPETRAVPGRIHLDETKTIFQDSGSTPRQEDLEPGGGAFMGGFVSPYRGGEESAAAIGGTGTGDTNKFDAKRAGAGAVYNVPPFAGAPFTTGYRDYENFWKNWDLFHHTSVTYREKPMRATTPFAKRDWREYVAAKRHADQRAQQEKMDSASRWDNMS